MSVTVYLQIRHEEMTDDLLEAMGSLHDDGLKSIIKQDSSRLDEWDELVMDSPSYEIGVSYGEESLADELKGDWLKTPTEITDNVIEEIRDMVEYYDRDDAAEIIEWLESHKGEEMLSRAE